MHAARSCSYWNIPALLQAGGDVRAVSDDGRTARDFVAPKMDAVGGGEFAYNRKNCQLTLEALRVAP
jgi:hypothetical protein